RAADVWEDDPSHVWRLTVGVADGAGLLPTDVAGGLRLCVCDDQVAGNQKTGGVAFVDFGVATGGAACAGFNRIDKDFADASAGLSLLDADIFDWATVLCAVGQRAVVTALVCHYQRSSSGRSIFSVCGKQSGQPGRSAGLPTFDRAAVATAYTKPHLDHRL